MTKISGKGTGDKSIDRASGPNYFTNNGKKYYTITDTDTGDIQLWEVNPTLKGGAKVGERHVLTYPRDKSKEPWENTNWLDGGQIPDIDVALNNKKLQEAARESSKKNIFWDTYSRCRNRADKGSGESPKECVDKGNKAANIVEKSKEQVEAQEKAEKAEEEGISAKEQEAAAAEDLKNAQQRKAYEDLIYPLSLESDKQDFIMFSLVEYLPRGLNSKGKGGLSSRSVPATTAAKGMAEGQTAGERKILGSAILPIPAGIQDQNNIDWGEDSMSPVEKAIGNITNEVLKDDGDVSGAVGSETKTLMANGKAMQQAMVSQLSNVDATNRNLGAVINKNTELLFGGPKLRSFNFTFRLSPRSAPEAKVVKKIIRFFKQGASAKKGENFMFIKAPHTFFIHYYAAGGEVHPWLNSFKECALSGVSVQYTPDGQYSTFPDGAMTSYSLQLSFRELEPVFDSDYKDLDSDNDSSIGY